MAPEGSRSRAPDGQCPTRRQPHRGRPGQGQPVIATPGNASSAISPNSRTKSGSGISRPPLNRMIAAPPVTSEASNVGLPTIGANRVCPAMPSAIATTNDGSGCSRVAWKAGEAAAAKRYSAASTGAVGASSSVVEPPQDLVTRCRTTRSRARRPQGQSRHRAVAPRLSSWRQLVHDGPRSPLPDGRVDDRRRRTAPAATQVRAEPYPGHHQVPPEHARLQALRSTYQPCNIPKLRQEMGSRASMEMPQVRYSLSSAITLNVTRASRSSSTLRIRRSLAPSRALRMSLAGI